MKQKLHLSFLSVLIILFFSIRTIAQDIHFSHIHSTPLHLNPSFAGVFNGDVRIIANYRNQWQNVTAKFNTFGVSADFKVVTMKNRDFLGIGVGAYMDVAGDLKFTNYTANVSLSYTKSLSRWKNHGISFGLYGGILNYSYDFTKARGFDTEPVFTYQKPNVLNYDVGAGLSGFGQIGKYSEIYAGFAIHHINRPNVSTYGAKEKLNMKYTALIGAEIANKTRHAALPTVMFSLQGKQQEITTGLFYRFEVNKFFKNMSNYLYVGAWARWHVVPKAYSGIDAVIFSARYDYQQWKFTFSYDLNVSTLNIASRGNGGPEISIMYIHQSNKKRGNKTLFCPRF